jgi:uncharacterized integral membrane protein
MEYLVNGLILLAAITLMFVYEFNVYIVALSIVLGLFMIRRWYLAHHKCKHSWKFKLHLVRLMPKPIEICLMCGPLKVKNEGKTRKKPGGMWDISVGQLLISVLILTTGIYSAVYIYQSDQIFGPAMAPLFLITLAVMVVGVLVMLLDSNYKAFRPYGDLAIFFDIAALKTRFVFVWFGWMVCLWAISHLLMRGSH